MRTNYPLLTISDGFNVVFKGLGSLNCKKTVSTFRVKRGASVLMGRSLPETQYQRIGAVPLSNTCTVNQELRTSQSISNTRELTGTKLTPTCI